ncbi:NAD(P)-dependent oxidoreductase [Limnohabitans sp. 2KL-17]|uniref:NAD-dependent epimerase/dehydratase family protein n=1 Tax=Limnohabitans sp. 2KL-17 TaxID=1100704 RepID=UPI001E540606|nr:NAD-dependent epimerase/dehydratase family protein [Limnohabitans sp. 2KL-17]
MRLRAAQCNYVVTGANGWLGSATLAMLRQALGDAFDARVTALGSRHVHPVQALLQWQPPQGQALIVFHYAFLTKDKVNGISTSEYIERNAAISSKVRGWIDAGQVRGVVLPSSGAVYDHLLHKNRDPAAVLYGRLKYQDELDFTNTCAAYDTSVVIPRVFNLSGPYINKFDSYALASFIQQVLLGKPIAIQAQKPVIRSYYFIGDLIELCVQLLLNKVTPGTVCFDTAGGEIVELGELAQRVSSVLVEYKPQAVVRLPIQDDAVADRYVGNREQISALEKSLCMQLRSLDQQITLTARYMQSLL